MRIQKFAIGLVRIESLVTLLRLGTLWLVYMCNAIHGTVTEKTTFAS